MATGRRALVCLSLLALVSSGLTQSPQCPEFQWQDQLGENPLTTNSGKVVLVALMKGYCSYCVGQARGLVRLKNHLSTHGMPDIAMVLVNGGETLSRDNIANLQNAAPSLSVLQDTEEHVMFEQIFRGNKDDFVVYDRCGSRVAYIPHPYSYLGHTVTERVLRAVYRRRGSCPCSTTNNLQADDPHDRMQGDMPMGESGYGLAADQETTDTDLECPSTDRICRRFQRYMRRHRSRLPNSSLGVLRPISGGYLGRHGGGRHGEGEGHSGHRQPHHHHHHHHRYHERQRSRLGGTL